MGLEIQFLKRRFSLKNKQSHRAGKGFDPGMEFHVSGRKEEI